MVSVYTILKIHDPGIQYEPLFYPNASHIRLTLQWLEDKGYELE